MRLTSYSDYSLRLLMYAALKARQLVTIQEVADVYGISKNHLMKVAFQLGRDGFLETVRGRGGGLRLARKPDEIGLGDVIRAHGRGFRDGGMFQCHRQQLRDHQACRLRGVLARALNAYLAVLDEYTLADLTARHPALERLLLPA